MNERLFALGNLTIDDIVVHETQKMYLGSSGGDVVFAAIGMRIWHEQVSVIARVGNNFPRQNIEQLKSEGIDVSLKRVSNPDIHTWALYEPDGARQFILQQGSGTYYDMSIIGDEIPEACMGAAGYHIAPMPTDVQATIVDRLRQNNAILSLDPHVLFLSEPALNRQAWHMLRQLDLFLPSREEIILLYGSDDPEAAARAFAKKGVPIVAVKLSTEGSLLYVAEQDKMYHIPIFDVDTTDPTGAGDSYCGGFLAGCVATRDPLLAACYGTVSASYVVEHVGALNTFESDLSEAHERLEHVRSRVREVG